MRLKVATLDQITLIANHLGVWVSEDTVGLATVDSDDSLVGMVILQDFLPNSALAHIWTRHPIALRCGLFEGATDYVFNTAGCGKLRARLIATNTRAQRYIRRKGFVATHVDVDGYAVGVDLLHFELTKEVWSGYRRRCS